MTAKTATAPDKGKDVAEITQMTVRTVEVGGVECKVARLKTREFLAFTRILLVGLGGELVTVFNDIEDEAKFAGRMAGAVLGAIPNAEDEFLVFLKRVVVPLDPSKKNVKAMMEALANPELEETMGVIEVLVEQEAGELQKLGKDLRAWWSTMGPTIMQKAQGDG